MRLRKRDLKPYVVKKLEVIKESDGTTYDGWGDGGVIHANVQPTGGKLLVEMYGARLAYMKVAYLENTNGIIEGDGICIDAVGAETPDYKVIAIRPWNDHYVMDLEKVRT